MVFHLHGMAQEGGTRTRGRIFGPHWAIRRPASDNFKLSLEIYFHSSFTDGREVIFLHHLANLWRLLTVDIQSLCVYVL